MKEHNIFKLFFLKEVTAFFRCRVNWRLPRHDISTLASVYILKDIMYCIHALHIFMHKDINHNGLGSHTKIFICIKLSGYTVLDVMCMRALK